MSSSPVEEFTTITSQVMELILTKYHTDACEEYGLQSPRMPKAKAILAKTLGFGSWKDFELIMGDGALSSLTANDICFAITTQTALDKTSDFAHPLSRLRALGASGYPSSVYEYTDNVHSINSILEFNLLSGEISISSSRSGDELFFRSTGDGPLDVMVDVLSSDDRTMLLGDTYWNESIGFVFEFTAMSFISLLFVHGNKNTKGEVPDNHLYGVNRYDMTELRSSLMDDYLNGSSYNICTRDGLFEVFNAYQSAIEKELAVGHISEQKIKQLVSVNSEIKETSIRDQWETWVTPESIALFDGYNLYCTRHTHCGCIDVYSLTVLGGESGFDTVAMWEDVSKTGTYIDDRSIGFISECLYNRIVKESGMEHDLDKSAMVLNSVNSLLKRSA
tara:strand:- start:374 stop:1546 length:1173 start_codon:yes stop_codon:yes gene_type:complete